MKTVTINFTAQTNVVSDYDLGRIGEHNATELVITPPTSLSGDSRTALYRVQFRTGSEIVTSESYTEVPFTVALWQQLTEHSRLSLQVVAYDANGEYIGKSDKLSGFYFNASVSGTPAEADEQLHGLEAEIAENTAARHTHSNKAILDDINFTVPKTVNGKSADGNREITLEADDISAASGWTPLDDTDLATKKYVDDNAGGKSYEILSSTPSVSNYTGAELWALFQAGERITYKNIPISYGASGASNRFIFSIYEFNSEGEPGIRSLNYVTSSKNITERTLNYFIKSINSVSVPSNGNINVTADKINAPSGWSPSSDTQLATKKYVDDNSGKALIVILSESGGSYSADVPLASIYAAFISGRVIYVAVEGESYVMPMLSAGEDNGSYFFWALATEANEDDSVTRSMYAAYVSGSWAVGVTQVAGLPPVSGSDNGKIPMVASGAWTVQPFPETVKEFTVEYEDDVFFPASELGVGTELILDGDFTAEGEALHNARITDIELYVGNAWISLWELIAYSTTTTTTTTPMIFTKPIVYNGMTIVGATNTDVTAQYYPKKIRIRYIKVTEAS